MDHMCDSTPKFSFDHAQWFSIYSVPNIALYEQAMIIYGGDKFEQRVGVITICLSYIF